MSAAGESLTPYIVTSQDSLAIRARLKRRGVRFGTDFILKSRSKPYISAELFTDYIRTVFLPNLTERRHFEEFRNEDVILLMDNCPSYVTDTIHSLFRDVRVRVIICPTHMTQIFQEFNISLFGVLKRREQYKLLFDDDEGTVIFRFKMYWIFKQPMVGTNICGAFQVAGFESDIDVESYRIQFDGKKLRRIW
jgi:hypothetical protein